MGSKGSQQTTTQGSQTYTPDPRIQQAGYQALGMAQNAANLPFQMPVAPVAGFSPFQQLGFGETLASQGMAQPYFGMGSQYLQGSAAPLSGEEVGMYYNPMAQNVTAQMQNIFGQQMRQATGQATQQAGGVGADRIGVAQANLANQQGLAAGQTYSQLYQQALQAAQQQKQMMAGAGYGLAQMGPAAQASQLQGIQALMGAGGLQQQLAQAQANAPYQNILAQIAYPYQQAQYLAGITGGLAPAMGGTTQGQQTTTQPSPSPFAQMLGVGTSLLGMGMGMPGMGSMGKGASMMGMGSPMQTSMGWFPSNAWYNMAEGGAVNDDYGKLSDLASRKDLGRMIPAGEAGNPIADEMVGSVMGALPHFQTGGQTSLYAGMADPQRANLPVAQPSQPDVPQTQDNQPIGTSGIMGTKPAPVDNTNQPQPIGTALTPKPAVGMLPGIMMDGTPQTPAAGVGALPAVGAPGTSANAGTPSAPVVQGPTSPFRPLPPDTMPQQPQVPQTPGTTQAPGLQPFRGGPMPFYGGPSPFYGGNVSPFFGGPSPFYGGNISPLWSNYLGSQKGSGTSGQRNVNAPGLPPGYWMNRGGRAMADGGDPNQQDQSPGPAIPAITLPKAGGASPIPTVSLPMGAGHSSLYPGQGINISHQQTQQGGGGSGIGKALTMAMDVLPMMGLAQGGGVNPDDIGQPFQEGGDIPDDAPATFAERFGPTDQAVMAPGAVPMPMDRPDIAGPPGQGISVMGAPQAYPTGPSGVSAPDRTSRRAGDIQQIMTDEWGKMGMPSVGVGGVHLNVGDESGFNPSLRHPDQPRWGGEAHYAHGLYQEGGAEWNRYEGWLKDQGLDPNTSWQDPRLQSRFAAWNLKTNYPQVWDRMVNAKTPGEAAVAYLRGYLKPAQQYQDQRAAKYAGMTDEMMARRLDPNRPISQTGYMGVASPQDDFRNRIMDQYGQRGPMGAGVRTTAADFQMPADQLPYPSPRQADAGVRFARQSLPMALIKAGAAMAQTRGPIGSVIGAGIAAGAGELAGQRKELRSEEDMNMKAQQLFQQAQIHLDQYQRETWKPTYATTKEGHPILYEGRSGRAKDAITGMEIDPTEQLGTRGGRGGQQEYLFNIKRQAWLQQHPGDENGALEFASGRRQVPEVQVKKWAADAALKEVNANPTLDLEERKKYWEKSFGVGEAAAAPAAGADGSTKEKAIADPGEGKRESGKWYVVDGVPKKWVQ